MRELSYVVNIPYGLHARPAAQIAQCCSGVKSTVMLQKEGTGKTADASKVLQILSLGVTQGDVLRVTIEGADEEEAAKCIGSFLSSTFDEKKSAAILKIAFFSMKDYDYTFFNELLKDKGTGGYNCEGKYIHTRLVPETAQLANGCGAVCIFVNDECGRRVLEILHDCGVRLVLLRCAGFNNVDLKAAAELGITVLRVPAYSPYAVAEHAMAILQEANRRLHKAYAKVRENNFGLSGLMGMDLHKDRRMLCPDLQGLRHEHHRLGCLPEPESGGRRPPDLCVQGGRVPESGPDLHPRAADHGAQRDLASHR